MNKVPPERRVPGTSFIVDGFTHQHEECTSYFLSHFHADHYSSLTRSWQGGTIYCTAVTAALVSHNLQVSFPAHREHPARAHVGAHPGECGTQVSPEYLSVLAVDSEPVVVENALVQCFDANHCPGAACFLFRVRSKGDGSTDVTTVLHTGDFRYCARLAAQIVDRPIDYLFLDTTYPRPPRLSPCPPFSSAQPQPGAAVGIASPNGSFRSKTSL